MGSTVFPAAASGPTLSEITTAITTNATPFNGTWTLVSSAQGNAATISFTGLSGYKKYRVYFAQYQSTNWNPRVRINNNTSSKHSSMNVDYRHATTTPIYVNSNIVTDYVQLTTQDVQGGFQWTGWIDFDATSTSGYKNFEWFGNYYNSGQITATGKGYLADTTAINRIDVYNSNGSAFGGTGTGYYIALFGGN